MKNSGLGLAFILEIVAFVAFADLGALFSFGRILSAILFIILLVAVLTFWSLFVAPKAIKKFSVVPYYVSKIVIYGLAVLVIFRTQNPSLGVLFIVATVIDELLLFRHNRA